MGAALRCAGRARAGACWWSARWCTGLSSSVRGVRVNLRGGGGGLRARARAPSEIEPAPRRDPRFLMAIGSSYSDMVTAPVAQLRKSGCSGVTGSFVLTASGTGCTTVGSAWFRVDGSAPYYALGARAWACVGDPVARGGARVGVCGDAVRPAGLTPVVLRGCWRRCAPHAVVRDFCRR